MFGYEPGTIDTETIKRKLPSTASVRHYELAFDIAIMFWRRDRYRELGPCARFMSTDSSPQANFDWLWCIYDEIALDDIVMVFRAVCTLEARIPILAAPLQHMPMGRNLSDQDRVGSGRAGSGRAGGRHLPTQPLTNTPCGRSKGAYAPFVI